MRRIELDQDRLPAQARLEVGKACRAAGTGPVCEESAVLATSEVVTNAMVHGSGVVTVSVEAGPEVVRVEVGDDERDGPWSGPAGGSGSALRARPSAHGQLAEGGRGLTIVRTVTSAWGSVDAPGGGKDVWFEVPVHP